MKYKFSKFYETLDISHIELLLMLPFLPIIAFLDSFDLIYIPFGIIVLMKAYKVYKKESTIEGTLLSVILYTIILPSNFMIIGFTLVLVLYMITMFFLRRKEYNIYCSRYLKYFVVLLIGFLVLNIALNRVPFRNILLFFLYNFVFVSMFFIYNYFNMDYSKEANRTFNTMVAMQIIYILVFMPLRFSYILTQLIGDWSIGTLGISQGPTLFNLFAFAFIKYLYDFRKTGERRYIAFSLISFLGAISTVSVSLTIIFIFSLILYIFIFVKAPKLKLGFLGLALLLMLAFWITADPWIKNQVIRTATDSKYRNYRITKLQNYEDTFITIPSQDTKFLLIGNGMGYYSSRAALTASGFYVPWYNWNKPYYKPTVSEYTRKYIKPEIFAEYGISITEHPVSQYISIMGEFGIVGLFLFLLFFIKLFIKGNHINKLTIIYFLGILLLDNWIEFPKVSMIFLSIYFLTRE